jgi:hypothetical protein
LTISLILRHNIRHNDTQHNNTQHTDPTQMIINYAIIVVSITMLSINMLNVFILYHCVELCRVIALSGIMQNVVAPIRQVTSQRYDYYFLSHMTK